MEQDKKRDLLALIDYHRLIREDVVMFKKHSKKYVRRPEYLLKSGVIERFTTNFQRTT